MKNDTPETSSNVSTWSVQPIYIMKTVPK
jgi:hypothetical protein